MITGVYQISIGDYYYFGSADDCSRRCVKQHLKCLKQGNHCNKKMQAVYNKYQTFSWEVVEDCDDRGMAYTVEQRYIDANFGRKHCLNQNDSVTKPPRRKSGFVCNEEWCKNISLGKTGNKYPNRKSPTNIRQLCIYCGREYAMKDITRFHNEKCKEKK